MSVTGHSDHRDPDDFYATPAPCVRAILPHLGSLEGKSILEPGCGDGAIIRALPPQGFVVGVEMNTGRAERARAIGRGVIHNANYFEWARDRDDHEFDIAIGNPPFKHAMEFLVETIRIARTVSFLLRLPFLASGERAAWLRKHTPSVNVLSSRPKFVMSLRCERTPKKRDRGRMVAACTFEELRPIGSEKPRTCPLCGAKVLISESDATDYAWLVWSESTPTVRILGSEDDSTALVAAE